MTDIQTKYENLQKRYDKLSEDYKQMEDNFHCAFELNPYGICIGDFHHAMAAYKRLVKAYPEAANAIFGSEYAVGENFGAMLNEVIENRFKSTSKLIALIESNNSRISFLDINGLLLDSFLNQMQSEYNGFMQEHYDNEGGYEMPFYVKHNACCSKIAPNSVKELESFINELKNAIKDGVEFGDELKQFIEEASNGDIDFENLQECE